MMQVTYALSQRDFFESMIAIRNRKTWAKWVFRASPVLLVLSIVFSVLRSPRSQLISNMTPLLLLLLVWVFLLWGSPWLLARTQFMKQPSAQGQRTPWFDGDEVKWQTYIRWMESKNQILLCSSPVQCGIVPKRALNAEQLSELRTLLTQRIGPALCV
jgi:hypothetical protein